jgi:hypothetical protein
MPMLRQHALETWILQALGNYTPFTFEGVISFGGKGELSG